MVNAEIVRVPAIIDNMSAYRKWVNPLLREAVADTSLNARQKLNASLALLRVDSGLTDDVYHRLLQAVPDEVAVICTELAPLKGPLLPRLWSVVESSAKGQSAKRLCAAAALAKFDPDGAGWTVISPSLTDQLVNENPFFLRIWNESFRPIKSKLQSSLAGITKPQSFGIRRAVATNSCATMSPMEPEILANLLMDGDEKRFAALFHAVPATSDRSAAILEREIERSVRKPKTMKETLANRQANAAVAMLKINHSAKIWTLLKHSPDPRARSILIHRLFSAEAILGH